MRFSVPLLLFSLVFSAASLAADVRYVGGQQLFHCAVAPARTIPSFIGVSPPVRASLSRAPPMTDCGRTSPRTMALPAGFPPATWCWSLPRNRNCLRPPNLSRVAGDAGIELASTMPVQAADPAELLNRINACDAEFNAVAQELHQLKQVSGKAVQLDIDNHRLVEEAENLRSDVEMLQAENQRLLDKLDSEDFMNGALAVLLGVIIALVAPRLVPKRRKNSGWN